MERCAALGNWRTDRVGFGSFANTAAFDTALWSTCDRLGHVQRSRRAIDVGGSAGVLRSCPAGCQTRSHVRIASRVMFNAPGGVDDRFGVVCVLLGPPRHKKRWPALPYTPSPCVPAFNVDIVNPILG